MSTILLTVQSVNGRNVTSYTKAFNVAKIIEAYDNASTNSWNGTSLVTYQDIEESAQKDVYGVSQSVSYINSQLNPDENIVTVELVLSNADIETGNATPIEIIPTPGAGKYISNISAIVEYDRVTGDISGNTTLDLVNSTTTANILATAATALAGSADKVTRFIDVAGVVAADEGVSVMVKTGEATMGTSAGTATVKIKYTIL